MDNVQVGKPTSLDWWIIRSVCILFHMGTGDKERTIRITAETIRAEKAARGLTQKALAERAGIPLQTFIRYEQGKRDIPMGALLQIVDALGVGFPTFARRLQDRLDEPEK